MQKNGTKINCIVFYNKSLIITNLIFSIETSNRVRMNSPSPLPNIRSNNLRCHSDRKVFTLFNF